MSLVKKEPGSTTESSCWSSGGTSDKSAQNNQPNNSRPPLKQKTENVPTSTAIDSDSKKNILSKYMLSPHNAHTNAVKKEPGSSTDQDSPLRIRANPAKKKIGKPVHTEKEMAKKQALMKEQGLQSASSSFNLQLIDPKAVRGLANESDNFSPDRGKQNRNVIEIPKNPGKYEKLNLRLNETDGTESAKYYDEVFSEAEWKQECIDLATYDISQWILKGQDILKEQHALMCRMVQARIKLSHRFQVISDIINERAELLIQQGEILDAKLTKVQDLGKEILDLL